MYRKPIASLAVVIALLAAIPALASEAGQYASNAGTKLGRGVLNTVTGWAEVPKQAVIGGQEGGVLGGFEGFFKGVGLGVARTLAGAFEIATFWAPVPERFEPVMRPATIFGNGGPARTAGEETGGSAHAERRAAPDGRVAHEQTQRAERLTGESAERVSVSSRSTSGPVQETPLRDIYFDYDSAAPRRDARETLLANAQWLRLNPHIEVTLEGHSDDRGKSEYNQVLGYRRVRVVRDFLVALGVLSGRISIVSYGSDRPFVLGDEESWRQWNRRVHFVVSEVLEPGESIFARGEP